MQNRSEIEFKWDRTRVHFGVIVVSTAFVLTILAQSTQFHELNRELVRIENHRIGLEEDRERLVLEVERQRNPSRIREWASSQLGMTVPHVEQIHDIMDQDAGVEERLAAEGARSRPSGGRGRR